MPYKTSNQGQASSRNEVKFKIKRSDVCKSVVSIVAILECAAATLARNIQPEVRFMAQCASSKAP
jgi:hypothetical protein